MNSPKFHNVYRKFIAHHVNDPRVLCLVFGQINTDFFHFRNAILIYCDERL
jgi:hypothetical protein